MMYYKILDIVNSISCFQLAVFSFFLIHKGRKNISNIILAAFFIAQFIVIFNFLLADLTAFCGRFHLQIAYIYYPFEFLWGPLLYFYIRSQVKRNFRFKYTDLVHLIPFVLAAVFIISYYYVLDSEGKYHIVSNGLIYGWFFYFNLPYYLLLFSYNIAAIFLLIKFQRDQKDYCSFVVKLNLDWLKIVLYGYIIACLFSAITNFAQKIFSIPNHIVLLALFVPFLIFFNILFYKALIDPYVIIIPEEKSKSSGSGLNDKEMQEYSESIGAFMDTHKPYLNPLLTLKDLSDQAGIADRIISQVINKHRNQNFFSFINSYRVEEAKTLLNSFDRKKSTMLGISIDSGFNSKSAFYDAFRKHTGMAPSDYLIMRA